MIAVECRAAYVGVVNCWQLKSGDNQDMAAVTAEDVATCLSAILDKNTKRAVGALSVTVNG